MKVEVKNDHGFIAFNLVVEDQKDEAILGVFVSQLETQNREFSYHSFSMESGFIRSFYFGSVKKREEVH